jgi:UDP-N-acetylglucosamine--N-acetylmuramyl-(pentapeptide) pyrophosphoryl-undecaprenol N-acetylglucosamine transferase
VKVQKTIVITGTHHTPAIELINQLKKDPQFTWKIFYLSDAFKTETHLIHTIIPKLGVKFIPLKSGKFHRRWLPSTIKGIPFIISAILSSYRYLRRIKPDLVMSFGGYISVPVIIAAWFSHIPSITHEQTQTISLATKINSFFVKHIALSFHQPSLPKSKVSITGNLLRSQIYNSNSKKYSFTSSKPLIYITGGSQGATFINQQIIKLLPKLSNYNIIHQVGKLDYPQHKNLSIQYPNYQTIEYVELEDIGWLFHHADLLISRSGANICQEIMALNQKSILIPLPFSQQNEQDLNALYVKNHLPLQTIVLSQNQVNSQILLESIEKLISGPKTVHPTQPLVNTRLLKLIHETI